MIPETEWLFGARIGIIVFGFVVIAIAPAAAKDIVSLAVAVFGVIGTHVGHVGRKSLGK
jgi:hypothetical protein